MKRTVLLILICLCFSININAQDPPAVGSSSHSVVHFDFTVYNTSNNHIFLKHPEIAQFSIQYPDKKPKFIRVLHRQGYNVFYNMDFKGDSLAFCHRYKNFNHLPANASLVSIDKRADWHGRNVWGISVRISKDSVAYATVLPRTGVARDEGYGSAARFEGEYERLAKRIADSLRLEGIATLPDSVIVLEGVIEGGVGQPIKDLKLIVGAPSPFSDIALQVIGNDRNRWLSATYGAGILGTSRYKLYIELHADGSVTILIPIYVDVKMS